MTTRIIYHRQSRWNLQTDGDKNDSITISFTTNPVDSGIDFEFQIIEYPNIGLHIGIYSDAFDALTKFSGLFERIISDDIETLDELEQLLPELFFISEGEKTNAYTPKK